MRSFFKIVLGLIAGLVILGLLMKAQADRHFFDAYDAKVALEPNAGPIESREGYDRQALSFASTPREAVPTLLALPKERPSRVPCIVFLHGIGQDKDFLDVIAPTFTKAGWAITSFDQYTRGERKLSKSASVWNQVMAFRQRACKTVNDARRLVDYLQTREEIDPERIYLVGASYGAITGSTAAAFDPRFKAVALIYGGGNLPRLLRSNANRHELETGPLGWLKLDAAVSLASYLMAPADPILHAGEISPRPVLLQNGEADDLIPTDAAQDLQAAVKDPKKIIVYPGNHIGMDEAMVYRVLNDALHWLQEQDAQMAAAKGK